METVKLQDDHDAEVFIETLLRNGYWVHLKQANTTQERVEGWISIEFEKEGE